MMVIVMSVTSPTFGLFTTVFAFVTIASFLALVRTMMSTLRVVSFLPVLIAIISGLVFAPFEFTSFGASEVTLVTSVLLVITSIVVRVVELGLLGIFVLVVSVFEAFGVVTFVMMSFLSVLCGLVAFIALLHVTVVFLRIVMALFLSALFGKVLGLMTFAFLARF